MAVKPEPDRGENPFITLSEQGRSTTNLTIASKNSSTSMLPHLYTQGLLTPRRDAHSITLLITSIYSTLGSTLFFVVALLQPKYGHVISSRGQFSPSSAALLTAFLAKTIELSFVVVCLAFIGQVLSKRAIEQKGVSLAGVSMRSWILQPGKLFTSWTSLRFAGFSVLGALSLVIAILSLLYTTAAGALVQPQLRLPPWEHKVLTGAVEGDFSSSLQADQTCLAKWPDVGDDKWAGSTCLAVKWSSLCGRNFVRYMGKWDNGTALQHPSWMSSRLEDRLPIFAALNDNVTVTTAWLDHYDVETESKKRGRIINNITIAVPHRGVPAAARNEHNDLIQPEDLHDGGSYTIHASVASFALNVMCANVKKEELAPIIYETWPNAMRIKDTSMAVNWWPILMFGAGTNANNKTDLDELFGWTDEDVDHARARPIFLKYPKDGNTIANHTQTPHVPSNRPETYILGKAPDATTDDYFLCSMKAGITTACTTQYNASSNGQSLTADCPYSATNLSSSSNDTDASKLQPLSSTNVSSSLASWRDLGFNLINSMSLNNGVFDGDASTARFLTQLQLREAKLNKTLPSPAEALLSIMTCTVLDLTGNFPLIPFDKPTGGLNAPLLQHFNASLRVSQYMSGGEKPYQKAFLVVLLLTLLINLFILIYFSILLRVRFITDLCEPIVLFILGYHSPSSDGLFKGLPQEGPRKEDLRVPWIVKRKNEQLVVVGVEEREDWEGKGEEGRGRFMMMTRRRVDKDEGLSPLSPVHERE